MKVKQEFGSRSPFMDQLFNAGMIHTILMLWMKTSPTERCTVIEIRPSIGKGVGIPMQSSGLVASMRCI
ncbi:MAG TPA: hypothetical protein DEA71_05915 [Nitrospira sp.]|nr:hypothetical protein [Nitrospira sp.]